MAKHEAELAARDEQLATLKQENELLRQKIDALIRQLFGAKSEKLDPAQLLLLLQGFDEPKKAPEPVVAEAPRRSREASPPRERGPRLPEHLPVIEEVIVPEPVKAAPQDWRRIGEEVSERLDYEPGRFLRRRTVRPKYVPRAGALDAVPIVAPLPESILERSIVAPGLLAQIVVSKYCDHLPLYRQESIYWTRHQVWLPRQTMAEWVGLAAEWLKPIYEQIRQGVFDKGYVQVDETPIRYLAPGNGKTKLGYLWTCAQPRGDAVFHWETSRAAACLERIVPVDFRGTLQCDGYEAYPCFAKGREAIMLAGCLAHVRRKFYEARAQAPKVAGFILQHIANLYAIEAKLRDARAGPKLRAATRASASAPILARLQRALVRLKSVHRYLPRSLMGQAIDYALSQWPALLVFLGDGRLEIDNNLVENAIRPTAVGKKNWLFIGEAAAGERSAIIYTVIESCRRRGLDPFVYLREVFTRLPKMTNWQVKELTPEAWAKSQRAARHAA